MLIYKDAFTGDELITDAFDLKEVDDVVYEVDCAMVQIKQGADVDIGANPSTEEAEEGVEDGVETVNNVVYSMRLQGTSFDKKSYLTYLKGYMKKVKGHLEEKAKAEGASDEDKERPEKFATAAQNYAKKIVASFKDWEFFTGESMDPDGMVVLLNYREDGTTPYLVYFKDGLKIEKV